MQMLKDCSMPITHELVPIVTMNNNSNMNQYHPMPEMLDNIPHMSNMQNMPTMQQFNEMLQNDAMALPQLELAHSHSQLAMPPPPPSQINILTGVYTLQEEPEESEENTPM